MLALVTSAAVVNLCGRLVTVLSLSNEKSLNNKGEKTPSTAVLVLILEFGHLAPKNSKKAI